MLLRHDNVVNFIQRSKESVETLNEVSGITTFRYVLSLKSTNPGL